METASLSNKKGEKNETMDDEQCLVCSFGHWILVGNGLGRTRH
jgi:hypothetical protein